MRVPKQPATARRSPPCSAGKAVTQGLALVKALGARVTLVTVTAAEGCTSRESRAERENGALAHDLGCLAPKQEFVNAAPLWEAITAAPPRVPVERLAGKYVHANRRSW